MFDSLANHTFQKNLIATLVMFIRSTDVMSYMLSWDQWGTVPLTWPEPFMLKDLKHFLFDIYGNIKHRGSYYSQPFCN